jgi:hypothetical protein
MLLQDLEQASRDRESNEVIQDLLGEMPINYRATSNREMVNLMTS